MAEHMHESNYKLSELKKEQKIIDKAPFQNLKIKDVKILDTIQDRKICQHCSKSRKYFCYTCYIPVIDKMYFPTVKLPIKIYIIKHPNEIEGKSTAIHAKILAPEDITIYKYPTFPDEFLDKEQTVLIFPSDTAINVEALFIKNEEDDYTSPNRAKNILPIKQAVFIDSTWHQTKAIYNDQRLKGLRRIILKSRISQFWRHQKKSPRWYLATIEAIHQFLVELHTCAFGAIEDYANLNQEQDSVINNEELSNEIDKRYNGQYDNLLYFFKYMYDKIHGLYDHDKLLAYKRPLM